MRTLRSLCYCSCRRPATAVAEVFSAPTVAIAGVPQYRGGCRGNARAIYPYIRSADASAAGRTTEAGADPHCAGLLSLQLGHTVAVQQQVYAPVNKHIVDPDDANGGSRKRNLSLSISIQISKCSPVHGWPSGVLANWSADVLCHRKR